MPSILLHNAMAVFFFFTNVTTFALHTLYTQEALNHKSRRPLPVYAKHSFQTTKENKSICCAFLKEWCRCVSEQSMENTVATHCNILSFINISRFVG